MKSVRADLLLPPASSLAVVVFGLAYFFTWWRFHSWMPTVFFGDDLALLLAYEDGAFPKGVYAALTSQFAEKYRPVFHWVLASLFGTFGDNISSYMVVNTTLHALNATLVFLIAEKIGGGRSLISFALATMVATSRFALYQVTQVVGVIEGLAMTFFLLVLYAIVQLVRGDSKSSWNWIGLALGAGFMCVHTHERYIVVLIWLPLVAFAMGVQKKLLRERAMVLAGGAGALLLFNLLYKILALKTPFFVGTGGTHINFDFLRVAHHAAQAALSIFGFNYGPPYLVGATTASLKWFPAWILAGVFVLICIWLLGEALRRIFSEAHVMRGDGAFLILLVALGGLLLVPALSTIRLEQRWLLEPFVILLFAVALAIDIVRGRKKFVLAVLGLAWSAVSVAGDTLIAKHFENIFFVSSGKFAAAVKRDIADTHVGTTGRVALVAGQELCQWTLQGGAFFRVYGGVMHALSCHSAEEVKQGLLAGENSRVYELNLLGPKFVDVSRTIQAQLIGRERVLIDFYQQFPHGRISDDRYVDAPSGRGAFFVPDSSQLGVSSAIVIVSGFSYRFEDIVVKSGASVRFNVAMVYPGNDAARAAVRIESNDGVRRNLFFEDVTPPTSLGHPNWRGVKISLSEFSGKTVSVTFEAQTPLGRNAAGHWVAFQLPRIAIDMQR